MKEISQFHKDVIATLFISGIFKYDDLEHLDISKRKAQAWTKKLLDKAVTLKDVVEKNRTADTELTIVYLLILSLKDYDQTRL
ncbi:hypothetical protein QWY77_08320 [Thalassotalea ponticola]|uniref:hypothetical protein n=1 Tax=Thalassotalea ponticola TaxID=1523392 RepID=UPI0025B510AF|nr:hypothetical protein [Thalassotalea ponticola]MDN3652769.1 hypothetical protein [Thalassotalea ponticola]